MQPDSPYGNALEQFDADFYTGFEDFGVEDQRLARLYIDHKGSVRDGTTPAIVDSLSNERFERIQFIPLVFAKQRIMWQALMKEGDDVQPMCKSVDNKNGFPNMDSKDPKELFDWAAARLDPSTMQKSPENGKLVIPCAECRLKEWGTHPVKEGSWCQASRTIPMLYSVDGQIPNILAVMTFKSTAIQPANAWFSSIARERMPNGQTVPTFSVVGEMSLEYLKKGNNDYCKPVFKTVNKTDVSTWRALSEQARAAGEYLRKAPRGDTDPSEQDRPDQSDWAGAGEASRQAPAQQSYQQAPVQQQAPVIQGTIVTQQSAPPVPTYQPPPAVVVPTQRTPEPDAMPIATTSPWEDPDDDNSLPF